MTYARWLETGRYACLSGIWSWNTLVHLVGVLGGSVELNRTFPTTWGTTKVFGYWNSYRTGWTKSDPGSCSERIVPFQMHPYSHNSYTGVLRVEGCPQSLQLTKFCIMNLWYNTLEGLVLSGISSIQDIYINHTSHNSKQPL